MVTVPLRSLLLFAMAAAILAACASQRQSVTMTSDTIRDVPAPEAWLTAGQGRAYAIIHDPSHRPGVREYALRAYCPGLASPV